MQHIRILNMLGFECVGTSAIINSHPYFQLATSRVFLYWTFPITSSAILAQLRVLDPCHPWSICKWIIFSWFSASVNIHQLIAAFISMFSRLVNCIESLKFRYAHDVILYQHIFTSTFDGIFSQRKLLSSDIWPIILFKGNFRHQFSIFPRSLKCEYSQCSSTCITCNTMFSVCKFIRWTISLFKYFPYKDGFYRSLSSPSWQTLIDRSESRYWSF